MSFHIDIWQAVTVSVCLCISSVLGLRVIRHVEKSEIQDENRKKKLLLLGCCIPVGVMFIATLLLGVSLLFFIVSLVLAFCGAALGIAFAEQVDEWLQRTFSTSPTEIDWTISVKPFSIAFALNYLVFVTTGIFYG